MLIKISVKELITLKDGDDVMTHKSVDLLKEAIGKFVAKNIGA